MIQPAKVFDIADGRSAIIATAIHAGHYVRPEIAQLLALTSDERLREEDPFTDDIAAVCATRVIGRRSRFEVDLNRPREQAFYREPKDAWGLTVWKRPPDIDVIQRSLAEYDRFYAAMDALLHRAIEVHGVVVLLDLHSYNHLRDGAHAPPADPMKNPEINVGTGSLDRPHWRTLVEHFLRDLRSYRGLGHRLDVRENVKFRGGNLSRWANETYPESVCALAIEFRKDFMDEWTGQGDALHIGHLKDALAATLPGLRNSLSALRRSAVGANTQRSVTS